MILEELEIEAHQAGEFFFEWAGQIIEAFVDRPAERFEVGIISVRQAPSLGQLPQPFDQVEIGAVAYYDIGEPYSEKPVQVLFGLGFVAQYTFAQQSYQGTSWSVLNGTQELRSFGVYGTAPVLLSVRLNPRVRFELGSELRIGGKNVAFQDRSTSTVNAQRLVSESDQSFSDVGLVFYPAYASLGLLINRDRKEREADKQE